MELYTPYRLGGQRKRTLLLNKHLSSSPGSTPLLISFVSSHHLYQYVPLFLVVSATIALISIDFLFTLIPQFGTII